MFTLLERLQAEIVARQHEHVLAEAAGAGHWITLHAEDSDEGTVHVFVGGGGAGATTITKGPSSLVGAKLGHLPSKKTHHPAGHEPPGAKDHPHYMEHLPPEKKKGKPYAKLHGAAQTHQEMGPKPLSADEAKAGLATAQAALKGALGPASLGDAYKQFKAGTLSGLDYVAYVKKNGPAAMATQAQKQADDALALAAPPAAIPAQHPHYDQVKAEHLHDEAYSSISYLKSKGKLSDQDAAHHLADVKKAAAHYKQTGDASDLEQYNTSIKQEAIAFSKSHQAMDAVPPAVASPPQPIPASKAKAPTVAGLKQHAHQIIDAFAGVHGTPDQAEQTKKLVTKAKTKQEVQDLIDRLTALAAKKGVDLSHVPAPQYVGVATGGIGAAKPATAPNKAAQATALHDQILQMATALHDSGQYSDAAYAQVKNANGNWAKQKDIEALQKSLAYMQALAGGASDAEADLAAHLTTVKNAATAFYASGQDTKQQYEAKLAQAQHLHDTGKLAELSSMADQMHQDATAQGLAPGAKATPKKASPPPAPLAPGAYGTVLAATHGDVTAISKQTAYAASEFTRDMRMKFHHYEIEAKKSVSMDLGTRMAAKGVSDAEATHMGKYFHFGYSMKTPQASFASAMLESWAGSSGDGKVTSLAMQRVADQIFHTQTYQDRPVFVTPQDWDKSDAMLADPTFVKAVTAGLQSMYDATQEQFAKRGITHVTLFRGFKSYSTGTAQKVMDGMTSWTAGAPEIELSPISSFTTKPPTTLPFCTGDLGGAGMPAGGHSLIIAGHVPVAQILGGFHAGFGCMGEDELTVLASKNTWKAYSIVGQGSYSAGYRALQDTVESY